MKIPFDIKYRDKIESGEYKVETRSGRPVRIICWDAKSNPNHIVALIDNAQYESVFWYNDTGKCKTTEQHLNDLFLVTPEEELTEFEQQLRSALMDARESAAVTNEDVKQWSEILLKIARKDTRRDAHNLTGGYEKGRVEALNGGKYVERELAIQWESAAFARGGAATLRNLPGWRKLPSIGQMDLMKEDIILSPDRTHYLYRIDIWNALSKGE